MSNRSTTLGGRGLLLALAMIVPLFGTGCSSPPKDDYWSFPVTRAVYGESQPGHDLIATDSASLTGPAAAVVLGILAIPLAVDLVIFPITAAHDFFWVD